MMTSGGVEGTGRSLAVARSGPDTGFRLARAFAEPADEALGEPVPVLMPLWWAELGEDRVLRVGRVGDWRSPRPGSLGWGDYHGGAGGQGRVLGVGRVGDWWSPTPGSLWWGNYHAETEDQVRDRVKIRNVCQCSSFPMAGGVADCPNPVPIGRAHVW